MQPDMHDYLGHMAVQVVAGDQAMHAAGLVHSDIKPTNILVILDNDSGAPRFVLADLGAAYPSNQLQTNGACPAIMEYRALVPPWARLVV
jgi:serine/threonine protein kinase